ncbi:hypothetical protein M0805_008464 [Coniferiporia weirii]|nr:hypothetical protein M0805_008464 [Coniferiporia weirii]
MLPRKRAKRSKKTRKGDVHETSLAEPGSSASKKPRDQYHHTVPRFVLRRFLGGERKKKAQRIKEYRRTGVDPDEILVYDMATKTLGLRSVGSVFGVQNLYRDIRDTQDVNALEHKLSILENKAAIIIKRLHEDLCKGESSLTRGELEDFRKFLFLMHYRNAALSHSYFEPTHPGNANSRNHIEQIQSKHGLSSAVEVWLHFLRYFLDTSHDQIMAHAITEQKKFGMLGLARMHASRLDPAVEHFEAIAYQGLADVYYLCIWQAADGEEFVLGSDSFGLWEGRMLGIPCLHRIFVHLSSDFAGIESAPPTPQYKGKAPKSMDELIKHRASAEGKQDTFTFKITKLNHAQMNAVNFVTLDNFRPDTSFTFLSKEKMLQTIREFCQSPATHRIFHRSDYKPLMDQLSIMLGQDLDLTEEAPSVTADPAAGYDPDDFMQDAQFLRGMRLLFAHFGGDDSDDDDDK